VPVRGSGARRGGLGVSFEVPRSRRGRHRTYAEHTTAVTVPGPPSTGNRSRMRRSSRSRRSL
jgi:hypothetical protein